MLINSSELRVAGVKVKESLKTSVRGGLRTRGAGLRSLEGMGPKRFVLSVDDKTFHGGFSDTPPATLHLQ